MIEIQKSKIGAVVVTFNPDNRLRRVLSSICAQVSNVIVVDNGSLNIQLVRQLSKLNSNIDLIELGENYGIGVALNVGLSEVSAKGLNWIVTLDQDSIAHPDMIKELAFAAIKFGYDSTCPIIAKEVKQNKERLKIKHEPIHLCITSGQLTSIDAVNNVQGFESDFFIDNVDFDFCLKLKNSEFSLGRIYTASLSHQLGDVRIERYCFHRFHTFHSPLRRYYIYRNSVYLVRRYLQSNPRIILKFIFVSLLSLFSIATFGKKRIRSFSLIFLGIFHAVIGRKGKL